MHCGDDHTNRKNKAACATENQGQQTLLTRGSRGHHLQRSLQRTWSQYQTGTESSKQVTARSRAYRLEVEKNECEGVRLDPSDRDDTALPSEGPWSEAEKDLGVALRHFPDGACA